MSKNTVRILAAGLVLASLLTACGGGDPLAEDSDSSSDAAATDAAAPEAQASDTAAIDAEATDAEANGGLAFEGQELVVANWNDYGSDIEWAVEEFEAATGATVTHQYFNSEEELLSMLRSGGVGTVDVALPNLAFLPSAIDDELVVPLDTSRLENYDELYPQLIAEAETVSDGEIYGVPWEWGSTSLAYNTDLVDTAPTSWDVLWDPANEGEVAFFDDAATAVTVSALRLGQDPYSSDLDLDAVRDDLLAMKPNVQVYWASADDWLLSFENESVTLGNLWSGLAGTQIGEGDPVGYIVPEEGAPGWLDLWTIVADSDVEDLSYAWIDYMISADYQARWAQDTERSSPAPANSTVADAIPDDVAARIGLDPGFLDTLLIQRGVDEETLQDWTTMWQEVKAS